MHRKSASLVAVLVLTACTSTTTPTTTAVTDDWFIYEGPPSSHAASMEGVLHIDVEARCVRVDDNPVKFPEGTSLDLSDPERPGLMLPSGRRFFSGDDVEFGGGGRFEAVGGMAGCGSGRPFAVGG